MIQIPASSQIQAPRLERELPRPAQLLASAVAAGGAALDAQKRRATDAYQRHQHPVSPAPRVDVRA